MTTTPPRNGAGFWRERKMTIERLKDGELGKTGFMCGFGLAKEYASNWITVFLMNNTHKTLAGVVKSQKFRIESSHYHYIIAELKNGICKGLLFRDGVCVYSAWDTLENIEIEEVTK